MQKIHRATWSRVNAANINRVKIRVASSRSTRQGRVRVEGVRVQKHHHKPGRSGAREGGIVESGGYVDLELMLVHPGDGKPSRVRIELRDGKRCPGLRRAMTIVPGRWGPEDGRCSLHAASATAKCDGSQQEARDGA
ncbi:MAG: hypothetical protein R3E53_13430 [Myxococcota bacterium]